MAWVSLIIAGLFEAFGVAMMNQLHVKRNWQTIVLLVLGFGSSFLLLGYSLRFITDGNRLCDLDRNWRHWRDIHWNDFLWRIKRLEETYFYCDGFMCGSWTKAYFLRLFSQTLLLLVK